MAPLGILGHFATLEDPRVERTRRHDLSEILVIAMYPFRGGVERLTGNVRFPGA